MQRYQSFAAQIVYIENLMLRTLGFDLNIQHSHTFIVSCCQLVRGMFIYTACFLKQIIISSFLILFLATKSIAETSYYLATNSLHLSTLCLQYKPTVVACICIYFVCKWSNFHVSEPFSPHLCLNCLFFRLQSLRKAKIGGPTLTIV